MQNANSLHEMKTMIAEYCRTAVLQYADADALMILGKLLTYQQNRSLYPLEAWKKEIMLNINIKLININL